jgi:uncharacterized glyoxalase superfamily protein PhnB
MLAAAKSTIAASIASQEKVMSAASLSKISAVLIVSAIEPCLDFWQRRLGFNLGAQVPHGDQLGFVILRGDGVEVMYQTEASVRADTSAQMMQNFRGDKTYLFVETADLDAIERALEGCDIVLPRRTTFYGSTEIGYREPGGHFVTFAQFKR